MNLLNELINFRYFKKITIGLSALFSIFPFATASTIEDGRVGGISIVKNWGILNETVALITLIPAPTDNCSENNQIILKDFDKEDGKLFYSTALSMKLTSEKQYDSGNNLIWESSWLADWEYTKTSGNCYLSSIMLKAIEFNGQ